MAVSGGYYVMLEIYIGPSLEETNIIKDGVYTYLTNLYKVS